MAPDKPEDRFDFSDLERLSASAPPPKERRGSPLTKAVAFLVPLIVLAVVPWLLLTRFMRTTPPTPKPSPSVTVSTTASASPSPSPVLGKGTYQVTGLSACLRVHATPGTGTEIIDCLQPGIQVTSDGLTGEADGLMWLYIHDPIINKNGWAASQYLTKLS